MPRSGLAWMPWLYFASKGKHRAWAEPWKREIQRHLAAVETRDVPAWTIVGGVPGRVMGDRR